MITIKQILILTLLLISSSRVFAQNDYGKVWVNGAPISFKTTFSSTGIVNQFYDSINTKEFINGHSNICDANGNLILASTGVDLYDANGNLIQNGDTLVPSAIYNYYNGAIPYPQMSIILPVSPTKYYLITPSVSDSEFNANWSGSSRIIFDLIYCHTIDMSANNGLGAVVRKKQVLMEHAVLGATRMTACRHGDGKSWWLLKQGYDSNIVYKFLMNNDTILGPYVQKFAEPYFTKFENSAQSVFSRDGTQYATSNRLAKKVFIANFDRCSGNLFNPRVIDVPDPWTNNPFDSTQKDVAVFGVAFSRSGRFLYVVKQFNILQFDLQDTNPATQWSHVAGLDTTWSKFQFYSLAYLGPDDKLYIGNWNGFSPAMSVINNPNVKGLGCNFCPKCLRFPNHPPYIGGYVSTPPNMPNYKLGATNPPCVVDVEEVVADRNMITVYPNPTKGSFTIAYKEQSVFILSDVMGKRCMTISLPSDKNKIEVDAQNLPSGVYFWHQERGGVMVNSGKLVIVQE